MTKRDSTITNSCMFSDYQNTMIFLTKSIVVDTNVGFSANTYEPESLNKDETNINTIKKGYIKE